MNMVIRGWLDAGMGYINYGIMKGYTTVENRKPSCSHMHVTCHIQYLVFIS